MTRLIAGAAGGRRLRVPSGGGTRPTSDRAREALFSALESRLGGLEGLAFLDLYAGSGAVGLEALSRGARQVTLAESSRPAATVIKANMATVGLPGATLLVGSLPGVLVRGRTPIEDIDDVDGLDEVRDRYDVVFLDPPYATTSAEIDEVLETLRGGWLADDALIVVERAGRDSPMSWPEWIEALQHRSYGEATLWYGRASMQ